MPVENGSSFMDDFDFQLSRRGQVEAEALWHNFASRVAGRAPAYQRLECTAIIRRYVLYSDCRDADGGKEGLLSDQTDMSLWTNSMASPRSYQKNKATTTTIAV